MYLPPFTSSAAGDSDASTPKALVLLIAQAGLEQGRERKPGEIYKGLVLELPVEAALHSVGAEQRDSLDWGSSEVLNPPRK